MSYDSIIDNMNYFNDPRVRAAERDSTVALIGKLIRYAVEDELDPFEEYGVTPDFTPEFTWEVCPMCMGEGTTVNPSIDAGGISSEQFYEDPDFADDYFGGVYDIQCPECKGRTTVQDVDFERLPQKLQDALDDWWESESADHAERMAEIRMGC